MFALTSGSLEAASTAPDPTRPSYHLHASTGQAVSERTFVGKVQVVTFGFVNCPDVCPTSLSSVSQAVNRLGDRGPDVQILFISVDLQRDRPEELTLYAKAFGPRVMSLTGTRAEVDDAVSAFRARYRIMAGDNGGYDVSHTGYVYILDRSGKLLAILPPNTTTARYQVLLVKALGSKAPKPGA